MMMKREHPLRWFKSMTVYCRSCRRKSIRKILGSVAAIALAGCFMVTPRWPENIQSRLQCGMTVKEIQRLNGRKLKSTETPFANAGESSTHVIGSDTSMARLDLWIHESDGLQSSQTHYVNGLKTMRSESRLFHCRGIENPKKPKGMKEMH